MILAINTAQSVREISLIDNGEILAERSWPDERDDFERLLPTLDEMLEEIGTQKEEITEILVVQGPGHYTAIRVGVTFANALAEGLNAKLHAIDTFELLRRKAAITEPLLVVTNAGGLDVGVREFASESPASDSDESAEPKVGPLADLLADFEHDKYKVAFELNETLLTQLRGICLEKNWPLLEGHELSTLGESILTFGLEGASQTDNAEPIYLKDPVITKSSDPWKNR